MRITPASIYKTYGPLRLALLCVTIVAIVLRPEPEAQRIWEGWRIVTDLLIPVLTPILFMLVMLDAIVSKIYMSGAIEDVRRRLRICVWTDLTVGIILLLYWLPFFMAISE